MVNCSRYTKNKAWEKERLVCQVLIFCVILCIGLFLRISAIDYSREIILGSDSATYDFAARNLMKYGVLTYDRNGDMYNGLIPVKPTEILNPGFPVFLAVLYQINDSTQFIYTVQLLLSMVILIMIYKILHLIGVSFWVAATAMLCAAVYPGFIYNLDYILTETLFTALMLLFAYFFLQSINGKHTLGWIALATAIVTYAALVRAQGLFYILVELFVIVTYMKKGNAKFKVKAFILVVGIAVGMLIPLWIRNWRCFGGFYVLTKAGDGPKIWGAQPFFLDMASTNDKELSDLIRINAAANKQTYWNWRIFGFFNYMWYDIWDELLVHACDYLRDLRLVHPLIVVPVITLIPILLRKSRMEVLFLASFPIAFSLMCMPYHGLARYVFPSIPFVFILLGILLSKIVDFLRGREGRTSEAYVISSGSSNGYSYLWIRRVFESAYGVIAVIFSGILVYSVFFYSWDIDEEMSSFRIGRTYGVTIEDVQDMEVIQEVQLNAAEGMWNIGNVVDQPDGSYQGMPDVTPIIDAVIPQMPEDPGAGVISKVELVIPGGYWFDKCTVYWTGHRTETISENTVYSMPRSRFSDKITVYIDDNIDTLMIVPCVFRDSEFRIESIRVTKYLVQ